MDNLERHDFEDVQGSHHANFLKLKLWVEPRIWQLLQVSIASSTHAMSMCQCLQEWCTQTKLSTCSIEVLTFDVGIYRPVCPV
jgi:hypothetical protein